VDYLYPTEPENLLSLRGLSARAHSDRYHGCVGWRAAHWTTFRVELDIAYCRAKWKSQREIPPDCANSDGHVRYWVKYADEAKPWLVIDQPLPLRWKAGHSERYGRFSFTPYNTNETSKPDKPDAFTIYDDIVIARNAPNLPWVHASR